MTGQCLGQPVVRVDGSQKVTGGALYAGDVQLPGMVHAVLVQGTQANARIDRMDIGDAEAMPGVLAVLSHVRPPKLPKRGLDSLEPPDAHVLSLLQDDQVHYNGQPIAVVVAERLEQALAAADRVHVQYEIRAANLSFDESKRSAHKPRRKVEPHPDARWGDVDDGLSAADVRIEALYNTPIQHHNPLEPHATLAHWHDDGLDLYDSTQQVFGAREIVAHVFGIAQKKVRVICPFVGGGFGCKGSVWSHSVLAAIAARAVGRPVKLALSRPQMFGPVGSRPRTEQRIVLGARSDGRLCAIRHDVISHTAAIEDYVESATDPTRALYACSNGATTQRVARLDVGIPTFQRAPGEATGSFAIESALDELASRLDIDPLELRLRNHADTEPGSGKPWSSKRLRECYERGARKFGWAQRSAAPGSMRDGDWRIGWGMATATYPGHSEGAAAIARMRSDGTAIVQAGTQDIGTGTYTVMTQVAADALGLPIARVRFELGDTNLPRAPISGGSMTVASVGPAVRSACIKLRDKLVATAIGDSGSPLYGMDRRQCAIVNGWLVSLLDGSCREPLRVMLARHGEPIEAKGKADGSDASELAVRSFGAVFVEVRVHDRLGMIRVPRVVAVYSVGRVLNLHTASSQLRGGIVWGLSMALCEESLLDERNGRFANANLAEYHVPVNADIGEIEIEVVPEDDTRFNSLGARGIGEIGITGVPAAAANAVYHATGARIRSLPIRIEHLLGLLG
jgi:xanthine dehydrogenase YagR molybdenum-binding subunit